jgi:hypothetical protein
MRSAKESKMGRPKIFDPRNAQLKLNLTAAEHESIVQRAKTLGMRPAHFSRALLLNSNDITASRQRSPSHIERLNYSALVRMGNNLNQMMRHLHRTGEPVPDDLGPLLTDIRQILVRGAPK